MTDLDLNQRKRILGKVSHLVETKHFNPALKGANWSALIAERFDRILTASVLGLGPLSRITPA